MDNSSSDLDRFLDQLAQQAATGDRLPTFRELMRRFGVSQVVVQRSFNRLKAGGLIESEVGRGTYFRGDGRAPAAAPALKSAPAVKSVLLLRRSISLVRGKVLVEGLQRRFSGDGHRVLELTYTDPGHALTVLKGLPRFDACVVQSTYRTITIELLAALKEKCAVLAVDGAALVGSDVEAVGMEWGEPLARAVALFEQHGHRSIAYATTSHPSLANQLGRRRFEYLQRNLGDCQLHEITLPHLPDGDYESALISKIEESLTSTGRPPFTALAAWGIENGARFREALANIGLQVPAALSVVLLARTDLVSEHADFFDVVGCSVADQVEYLYQATRARWVDPSAPYGVQLIPLAQRVGQSVASPAAANRPRRRPTAVV